MAIIRPPIRSFAIVTLILGLCTGGHAAEQPATVTVPGFPLPPSSYTSSEARSVMQQALDHPDPAFGNDIAAARSFYGKFNDERLAEMRRRYAVNVRQDRLGGVTVDRVVPASGIARENRRRVLINIHGGAFMWGSGSGALVEAIPIAAVGGIEVIAIDYRLAARASVSSGVRRCCRRLQSVVEDISRPEHRHLRLLRRRHHHCAIHRLVRCLSASHAGRDRHVLRNRRALRRRQCDAVGAAQRSSAPSTPLPNTLTNAYMSDAAAEDPLAYPTTSEPLLRKFPPTLHLAGSRDFAASVLTRTHRKLLAAGVDSLLVLFDGLGHAFFMRCDLPESQEAYEVIWQFFDRRLAKR